MIRNRQPSAGSVIVAADEHNTGSLVVGHVIGERADSLADSLRIGERSFTFNSVRLNICEEILKFFVSHLNMLTGQKRVAHFAGCPPCFLYFPVPGSCWSNRQAAKAWTTEAHGGHRQLPAPLRAVISSTASSPNSFLWGAIMSAEPIPPIVEPGSDAFPILTAAQIDRLRPIGQIRQVQPERNPVRAR